MKYIAEKTTVPVPSVIAWNSDASNEVGAEYMFISKVNHCVIRCTSTKTHLHVDIRCVGRFYLVGVIDQFEKAHSKTSR